MIAMVFKCVSEVFSSVSEACFKCFNYLQTYVATVVFGCFKSRLSVASLLLPTFSCISRLGVGAQARGDMGRGVRALYLRSRN
jgi:hypothetical protein